jgi:hypothetical protein
VSDPRRYACHLGNDVRVLKPNEWPPKEPVKRPANFGEKPMQVRQLPWITEPQCVLPSIPEPVVRQKKQTMGPKAGKNDRQNMKMMAGNVRPRDLFHRCD